MLNSKLLGNKEKTAKMRFYQSWQGQQCNSRVDFIRNLLSFGKGVKMLLQFATAYKS